MHATPKRAMVRMTFNPKDSLVIPYPKAKPESKNGQWKTNPNGTVDVWMTEGQYAEIMSFVDALLMDFQSENAP